MKLFSKKLPPQNQALLQEIAQTKLAMETAYSNFENVVEPDLIDSYIYQLNAVQERYKFLIRQAKAADSQYPIA